MNVLIRQGKVRANSLSSSDAHEGRNVHKMRENRIEVKLNAHP